MKKKILLVDDSKTQLTFFKHHLENVNYDVITASTLEEGFLKIFEEQPDLIVTDFIINNSSGYQLSKIIKSNIILKNIPIILFTSAIDILEEPFWLSKIKVEACLEKDVNVSELLKKIELILKKYEVTQETKKIIKANTNKAKTIFDEHKIISDLDWIKLSVLKELRMLENFFDNFYILSKKLFKLLESVINYDVCFFFENKYNQTGELEVITNIHLSQKDSQVFLPLVKKIIDNTIKTNNPIKIIPAKFDSISSTTIKPNDTSFKSNLIYPIRDKENKIIAVLAFYSKTMVAINKIAFFDEIIKELTELLLTKIYNDSLKIVSFQDKNTQLYNGMHFFNTLSTELVRSENTGTPISFAMIKFCNYKEITRKYGADISNILLKKAIEFISSTLRSPDNLYRYNPASFIIVFPNITAEQALHPIERIASKLNSLKIDFSAKEFSLQLNTAIMDNSSNYKNEDDFFEKIKTSLDKLEEEGYTNRTIICNDVDR